MLARFLLGSVYLLLVIVTDHPGASAAEADVKDGVSLRATQNDAALPRRLTTFDPPCQFQNTLPLANSPYMNPKTRVFFRGGNGSVMNSCANFAVTGFSGANFLAWNCATRNADGTVPTLPAEFEFSTLISSMAIRVGSTNAGATATLVGLNSSRAVIARHTVTLTSALQQMSVRVPGRIKYARLIGPCVAVADNLIVVP